MIEAYNFGKMVIQGRSYTNDLVIFPDGKIRSPWWRKTGHKVLLSDIKELVGSKPDTIIIGKGRPGLMKPDPELEKKLKEFGIVLKVFPTKQAAAEYNNCIDTNQKVGACFHLTC